MKKKLLLTFPKQVTGKPITYDLIKQYDMRINILRADVDFNVKGTLLLEVETSEENINAGIQYMKDNGIVVKVIDDVLEIDEDKCVNCGACTSICPVDALEMDESWSLVFYADRCLDCKLCIKSCPTRAISSIF